MDQLGLGIIGTGRIAHQHIKSLKAHPSARVVSVMDIIPERSAEFAREHGVPHVSATREELLDRSDIDAVIVSTPPCAHAGPTLAALRAGKHVLCEKPFTLDPADAHEMTALARKVGKHLAVCSARRRCGAAARRARQMVLEGELGQVYYARSTFFRQRGRPGLDFWPDATWFLDKSQAGGGTMMDMGVYQIDQIIWLMGSPRVSRVLATTFQGIGKPAPEGVVHDVDEHVSLMLSFENGASAVVENAWCANMCQVDQTMVLGSKGGLRFDPLTFFSEPDGDGKLASGRVLEVDDWDTQGHGDVTTAFVNAVIDGRQPMTSAEDACVVTEVIHAAYRSVATGTAVSL